MFWFKGIDLLVLGMSNGGCPLKKADVLMAQGGMRDFFILEERGARKGYAGIKKKRVNYYPFGMLMPGRHYSNGDLNYRYGFQGQEVDNEIKGDGNSVNFLFRMHDARLGRFFAVDPLSPKYPHYTPYSFSGNRVIAFRELEGLEEISVHDVTWFGGTVYARADFSNLGDQIAAEIHAQMDDWWFNDDVLPDGFRVRRKYTVKHDADGFPVLVPGEYEIVPTAIAREGLFWNYVGYALGPLQFADITGETGVFLASSKGAIPLIKRSALELFETFQKGTITRTSFKRTSYTRLKAALSKAGRVKIVGDQGHHLIPMSLILKSPIVQKAIKFGFDFNSAKNGEWVNIFTHTGKNMYNHPEYTKYAEQLVNTLDVFGDKNIMKNLEFVLQELRDVVKTAQKNGLTLDEVAKQRMKQ